MGRALGSTLALAVALTVVPSRAHAATGTCTITQFTNIVPAFDLAFGVNPAGLPAMPVEFDEAAGTFSMSRDAWATQYGAEGLPFDTVAGVKGYFAMEPGTVAGTIDAAGHVVLPSFGNHYSTDFCAPRPDYPQAPTLSTSRQRYVSQGADYFSEGSPMDPTTGELTLEGYDVIPNACGAGGPLINGLRIECRLNPIPNLAQAIAATALQKVSGQAKIGKALPTAPPAKPDKGDVLTLKATLVAGPAPVDFTASETYLELLADTESLVVVRIPAGKLVKRGKAFRATDKPAKPADPDGVVFDVRRGKKRNDAVEAATGGTVTLTPGKKGIALKATVQGLDLAALAGTIRVVLLVGDYEADANVTVRGAGAKRRFK